MKGLILFVVVLVVSGCRVPLPRLPEERMAQSELTPFVQRLRARSAEVRTLRALSRTEIKYGSDSVRLRHALLLGEEGALRIDTLAAGTAYTLGLLTARGDSVLYLDAADKTAYRGESAYLVEKAIGVPLEADEVAAYVTARVPQALLDAGLEQGRLRGYRGAAEAGLVLAWENFRYVWRVDPETLLLREVEIRSPFTNRLLLTLQYERIVDAAGVKLPQRLRVQIVQKAASVLLDFTTLTANAPISPGLFDIPVPRDYRLRESASD